MSDLDTEVRYFSNSELQTFKDCRRRWYLTYFRGLRPIRPKRTGPLTLGTRVHLGLEALDSDGDMLAAYDASVTRERAALGEYDDHAAFEKEATLGRTMLEGYAEWLAETGADATVEVVGVEEALSAPLHQTDHQGRPVRLLGKLDRRLRRYDGVRLFDDHKTAQSFSRVFSWLALNEQFLTYQLLERLTNLDNPDFVPAIGARVNVLRKVGRGKTAKPPFYAREEVHHSDVELRAFWHRVRAVTQDVLDLETRIALGADPAIDAYPRPSTDCSWKCPFVNVCQMFDDGSDVERALSDLYEEFDPLLRYRDEHRHPDVDREAVGESEE